MLLLLYEFGLWALPPSVFVMLAPGISDAISRTMLCGPALWHPPVSASTLCLLRPGQAMVDDWEFSEAQFTEFVGTAFALLAAFMGTASEFDSQLQVTALPVYKC